MNSGNCFRNEICIRFSMEASGPMRNSSEHASGNDFWNAFWKWILEMNYGNEFWKLFSNENCIRFSMEASGPMRNSSEHVSGNDFWKCILEMNIGNGLWKWILEMVFELKSASASAWKLVAQCATVQNTYVEMISGNEFWKWIVTIVYGNEYWN